MKYTVVVSNPTRPGKSAFCEAMLELRAGHPRVPSEVIERLDLPGWARFEFEGRSTYMSVEPSSDDLVQISLAMLTALGLQLNRSTGELESLEFLLPTQIEVETS